MLWVIPLYFQNLKNIRELIPMLLKSLLIWITILSALLVPLKSQTEICIPAKPFCDICYDFDTNLCFQSDLDCELIGDAPNWVGTACFNVGGDTNCQFYYGNGLCEKCVDMFGLNQNLCIPCPSGCLTCDLNDPADLDGINDCTSCIDPQQLPNSNRDGCVNCYIPGCIRCNNAGDTCLQCDLDLLPTLNGKSCVECLVAFATFPTTALTCNDQGEITSCMPPNLPLLPNLDSCVTCAIAGCQFCIQATIIGTFRCEVCIQGALPVKPNVAGTSCFQCNINFCRYCSMANRCEQCEQGLALSQNFDACIVCPTDCLRCQADGTCIQCVTGKLPSADGSQCFTCNSAFCTTCSNNNVCQVCTTPGFVPNALGTACNNCGGTTQNCAVCSDALVCTRCTGNLFLDATNVCRPCPTGCQVCSAANTCMTCTDTNQRPIFPTSNACIFCSNPLCASCISQGVCGRCVNANFRPNTDGSQCFKCDTIPGCINCDSTDVCSACMGNLFLNVLTNTCQNCPVDCTECFAEGRCAVCSNVGQKPNIDGTDCLSCNIPGCQNCFSAGVCERCVDGFYPNAAGTACIACVQDCAICETATVCGLCQSPFERPNNAGTACVACNVNNCAKCNSPNVCSLCQGNDLLVSVAGIFSCAACPDYCQICSSQNICQTCANEYERPNVAGTACNLCDIPFCTQCSADRVCAVCSGGRTPATNGLRCVAPGECPVYCRTCSTGTTCVECINANQRPNAAGTACVTCTDSNCIRCSTTNTCIQCSIGFTPQSGNCVASAVCPAFCQQCNVIGECITCATANFKPNVNGNSCFLCTINNCINCGASNSCQRCQSGYDLQGNQCISYLEQCPSFCADCNAIGQCIQCDDVFSKPNIAGTACFTCNINDCINCGSSNTCQRCRSGYDLQNNRCVSFLEQCPIFCADCNAIGECIQCNDPLSKPNIAGTACFPCNINDCINCGSANTCQRCRSAYDLQNNRCVSFLEQCPSYCADCNAIGECIQCNDPYSKPNIAGTACFTCMIDDCINCGSAGTCSRCRSGYDLQNNECIEYNPNDPGSDDSDPNDFTCPTQCSQCNYYGQCIACRETSKKPNVAGTSCFTCNVNRCLNCDAINRCERCASGYFVNTNGECTVASSNCGAFCSSCSPNGQCLAYRSCPSSTQKPNVAGTACFTCNITNCDHCSANNICQQCNGRNVPIANGQKCGLCQSWCKTCSSSYHCEQCAELNHKPNPSGTYCVECSVPRCESCYSSNRCARCTNGLRPNSSGQC